MKRLFSWVKPDYYHTSVYDIDLGLLKDKGIKNLLVDLDNTLVPWGEDVVDSKLMEWLDSLSEKGFNVCVLSNNKEERAAGLCGVFGIPYVAFAKKPLKKAFRNGLAKLGARKNETAVIGDQMFTDILGGNLSGLSTILVVPLSKKEFWGTKIARFAEWFILRALYGRP